MDQIQLTAYQSVTAMVITYFSYPISFAIEMDRGPHTRTFALAVPFAR